MNSEVSPPILHPGLIIYQLMASRKLLNLFVISTSHVKKNKTWRQQKQVLIKLYDIYVYIYLSIYPTTKIYSV